MAEKNKKLTPFEKEQIDTAKKVLEYKTGAEANVVSIIYKEPELLYNTNLTLEDFHDNVWRVYFEIARELILVEKKSTLDEITIGMFLEKHNKLRAKYEEYNGYETIKTATGYINVSNFDGYITELRKWGAIIKLIKRGFPVKDKLSEYTDMAAEDIYHEFEVYLNDTFVNIDSDVKSYDICDGIFELIEDLDAGHQVGLPYDSVPTLTKETNGQWLGSITLLGGLSNIGKSTLARSWVVPSIIKYNERVVIMVNEDSISKWQREMLVWICNNILKFDIQKHTIRDGKYTKEVKDKLYEAAQWLKDNTQNHMITIIPFQQYQTAKAIKEIKKYAHMGVKYFILDTFKMDAGKVSANAWLEMQQSMVDIKDTVKTEALNLHILITFQLEKGSSVMRYYTQNNVGMAKNIVDVASTVIMVRDVFEDEYTDEKRALKVYRLEGKNGKTKVQVKLDKDKTYQVVFVVKNQEGAANAYQMVINHDKSRNIIKEVGVTNIMPDSF